MPILTACSQSLEDQDIETMFDMWDYDKAG